MTLTKTLFPFLERLLSAIRLVVVRCKRLYSAMDSAARMQASHGTLVFLNIVVECGEPRKVSMVIRFGDRHVDLVRLTLPIPG
jgi:hypothetical protein